MSAIKIEISGDKRDREQREIDQACDAMKHERRAKVVAAVDVAKLDDFGRRLWQLGIVGGKCASCGSAIDDAETSACLSWRALARSLSWDR